MKKSGRTFLLVSWLIVRLRWAMHVAIEKTRSSQPVSIVKLTTIGSNSDRWLLYCEPPVFLKWSSPDRRIRGRQLPLIVPN
jgi:hypothetical protein